MDKHPLLAHHGPVKGECSRRLRSELTPAEQRLWRELRANRLAGLHFRRQQVLFGFIADFYCHAARLAVELDGAVHQERAEYDQERDRILEANGIRSIRFPNDRIDSAL